MKVCVVGLWHLGTVTAACVASGGHDVIGLDVDSTVIAGLVAGRPPLSEPGLEELVKAGLASGRLRFTTDVADAVANAEVVWIAHDTPMDDDDRADVEYVIERVTTLFPHLRDGALVLISSQVPIGTTRRLEQAFASELPRRTVGFGYSPENLRFGEALTTFRQPDRIVVGVRSERDRETVSQLLRPLTGRIEWMSVESAEMTKHAVNAFLATSVVFINEIGALCEQVGADATEVERGLKSEARIGPKAYLSPGGAFTGGTLARDMVFLAQLGKAHSVATLLLSSVMVSNDAHMKWAQIRLSKELNGVGGKTVAVWGLTSKPGTDSLRRSSAVELCRWLHEQGATVRAHDPAVKQLPLDVASQIRSANSPLEAVTGASALVVATPWPEYRQVAADELVGLMTRRLVLDASRSLEATLGSDAAIEYLSVGKVVSRTKPIDGRMPSRHRPIPDDIEDGRLSLLGRNCVLTGTSRGLGRSIATAFGRAGASMLLVARSEEHLRTVRDVVVERDRQRIVCLAIDVASPGAPEKIAERAKQEFGAIDVLVNNAGALGCIGSSWTIEWKKWIETLQVNLLAPIQLCRVIIPLLRSRAKIINLSGGGAAGPRPNFSAYAVSKAALVRFSETLAAELAFHSVDVNCVAPGPMNTEMLQAVLDMGPELVGHREWELARRVCEMGEGASLDNAAALCVFLASTASDGLTGKLISAVWDGWRSLPFRIQALQDSDVYTLRRIIPRDRGFDWPECT